MKKLLTITLILLSGYLYAQDTVVTKETVITGNDTDIVYTVTAPSSTRIALKELQAQKAGLQAEKAVYQGYIQLTNEKIARINEKIARLKAQAQ